MVRVLRVRGIEAALVDDAGNPRSLTGVALSTIPARRGALSTLLPRTAPTVHTFLREARGHRPGNVVVTQDAVAGAKLELSSRFQVGDEGSERHYERKRPVAQRHSAVADVPLGGTLVLCINN